MGEGLKDLWRLADRVVGDFLQRGCSRNALGGRASVLDCVRCAALRYNGTSQNSESTFNGAAAKRQTALV